MRALLFSKYCSEKWTMCVTRSRQNSVTYNKLMPEVHILQNMIAHVEIKSVIYTVQFAISNFSYSGKLKILTAMSKPIEFSVKFVLHALVFSFKI